MSKNKEEYDWKKEIDWYVEEYVKMLPDVEMNQMTAEAIARVIFRNLLARYAEKGESWTKQEFFRDELNSLQVPIIAKDRKKAMKMNAQRVIRAYVDDNERYLIRPTRKEKTGKGRGGVSPFFFLNLEKFEEIKRRREKEKYYSPRLSPLLEKLRREKDFENGEWDYEVPIDGKKIDAICIKNGIYSIVEENEKLDWDTYGEVDGKAILYSKLSDVEKSNIKKVIVVKYGDDSIERVCKERDIIIYKYNI